MVRSHGRAHWNGSLQEIGWDPCEDAENCEQPPYKSIALKLCF